MAYKWNTVSTLVAPMGDIKFEVIKDCKRDSVFPFRLKLRMNDSLVLDEDFTTQENAMSYAENIIENFRSFNDLRHKEA